MKKWELLETIEPWGLIGLAARIYQAFNGGRLREIADMYIGRKKEQSDEDFIEQVKQSQIINRKS